MITLKVLGGVALESEGVPLSGRVVQRRRLALLAILAAARARAVSRDRLVALLWPETRGEQARALLSDSLYVVRKALGDDALLACGDDLRLNPERVCTDLAAFEEALDAGDVERAIGEYAGPSSTASTWVERPSSSGGAPTCATNSRAGTHRRSTGLRRRVRSAPTTRARSSGSASLPRSTQATRG